MKTPHQVAYQVIKVLHPSRGQSSDIVDHAPSLFFAQLTTPGWHRPYAPLIFQKRAPSAWPRTCALVRSGTAWF